MLHCPTSHHGSSKPWLVRVSLIPFAYLPEARGTISRRRLHQTCEALGWVLTETTHAEQRQVGVGPLYKTPISRCGNGHHGTCGSRCAGLCCFTILLTANGLGIVLHHAPVLRREIQVEDAVAHAIVDRHNFHRSVKTDTEHCVTLRIHQFQAAYRTRGDVAERGHFTSQGRWLPKPERVFSYFVSNEPIDPLTGTPLMRVLLSLLHPHKLRPVHGEHQGDHNQYDTIRSLLNSTPDISFLNREEAYTLCHMPADNVSIATSAHSCLLLGSGLDAPGTIDGVHPIQELFLRHTVRNEIGQYAAQQIQLLLHEREIARCTSSGHQHQAVRRTPSPHLRLLSQHYLVVATRSRITAGSGAALDEHPPRTALPKFGSLAEDVEVAARMLEAEHVRRENGIFLSRYLFLLGIPTAISVFFAASAALGLRFSQLQLPSRAADAQSILSELWDSLSFFIVFLGAIFVVSAISLLLFAHRNRR